MLFKESLSMQPALASGWEEATRLREQQPLMLRAKGPASRISGCFSASDPGPCFQHSLSLDLGVSPDHSGLAQVGSALSIPRNTTDPSGLVPTFNLPPLGWHIAYAAFGADARNAEARGKAGTTAPASALCLVQTAGHRLPPWKEITLYS